MSNCEKNASNDAPAPRQRSAAASALHAMPDDSPQLIRIQENLSNPGPLGLFGFALTTALLQGATTGLSEAQPTRDLACAFGMAYGGLAQLLAGQWEMRAGNTFGATAFSSYGAFWMGFALFGILKQAGIWNGSSATGVAAPYLFARGDQLMLSLWGILTTIFFLCTLRSNRIIQSLFGTLAVLFFMLAIGVSFPVVTVVAGWWGLGVAAIAFYAGASELGLAVYGKQHLPMFPVVSAPSSAASSKQRLELEV